MRFLRSLFLGLMLLLMPMAAQAEMYGTLTKNTQQWGGVTRDWWLWKPVGFDPNVPADVIFVLPRTGVDTTTMTPGPAVQVPMADFFYEYGNWPPTGSGASWDSTQAANQVYVYLFPKSSGWQATGAYNDTTLVSLIAQYLAAPGRVFAAGFNKIYMSTWNGAGDVAMQIACTPGNALGGVYFFGWGAKLADQTACTWDHIIPAMFQYGAADNVMPVNGNSIRDSVAHTAEWWATKNNDKLSETAPKPGPLGIVTYHNVERMYWQPNCNWDQQGFVMGRNPAPGIDPNFSGYKLCWYEPYIDNTDPPQAQGSGNIQPTVYYQHFKRYDMADGKPTVILVTGDKAGNAWPGDHRWNNADQFATRLFGPNDAYLWYPDGSINMTTGWQNYPPNCSNPSTYSWRSSYPASVARALWRSDLYCIK